MSCQETSESSRADDHTLVKESTRTTKSRNPEIQKPVGKDYELNTPFPVNMAGVYYQDGEPFITDYCQTANPGITFDFEENLMRRNSRTHQLLYIIDTIYPELKHDEQDRFQIRHLSVRDSFEQASYALMVRYDKTSKLYTISGLPQILEYEMTYDTLFADRNHSDHVPHMAEICD